MYCKKGDLVQFVLNPIYAEPHEVPYTFAISDQNIGYSTDTLTIIHSKNNKPCRSNRNFDRHNIVLPVDNEPRDMVTIQPVDEDDDYVDRPESVYVEIVSQRDEEIDEDDL